MGLKFKSHNFAKVCTMIERSVESILSPTLEGSYHSEKEYSQSNFHDSSGYAHRFMEGLTYDDVLMIPGYSEILPRDASVATKIAPEITLQIPIISAAMDTVTEYQMAIGMAVAGGLGIIHKSMSIRAQAEQVRRVKRYESGLIVDPITLSPDDPLSEAFRVMKEYSIGGIPITDAEQKLVGVITNRDVRFEAPSDKPISSIMTAENLITAPEGTNLDQAEEILRRYKIEKLPVIDKDGKLVGLITYKDILKRTHYPLASKDEIGRLRVGAAVGVTGDVFDRIDALIQAGVDIIAIDTAHAHSYGVLDLVKKIKQRVKIPIMVGNVATRNGADAVAEAGADCIKVGIGPGSICTTRVVAGVGFPQLSAILESFEGIKKRSPEKYLIADGGVKYSGDVAKALAAGASAVMAGNLFAGTEESPGETIIYDGRKFKSYRGMGSIEAMQQGSKDRYFQDIEEDIRKLVPEGIVGKVPFKGNVSEVLYQIIGGLRAGMGYCGVKNLSELRNINFVRITHAGLIESHPHGVHITREAPNYSRGN